MDQKWHLLSQEKIFEKLNSSEEGLSQNQVKNLLNIYGSNILPTKKRSSLIVIFFNQFNSSLIFILLFACIITFLIGETVDATIILAVLVFNAITGTIQEGKAENTLSALKKFVETKARVVRDSSELIVSDLEVVPGDILNLEEGDKIPADARVILSRNLKIDEAALTGESAPIYKISDELTNDSVSVSDQKNMLFKGTNVVSGNGKAIVVATGSNTVIGKIAKDISLIDAEIPLKKNIKYLSHVILFVVIVVSVLIFGVGVIKGETVATMFITTISLLVSVIPEGLPIVMTLVLATGVFRMSKKNALVKKLQAVEALGQARIIAVDKTGTITKNELVVREVWIAEKQFNIEGIGYEPKGDIKIDNMIIDAADHVELLLLGKSVSLCANARLSFSDIDKNWHITGDPTEAALMVFAEKIGFKKDVLLNENPEVSEIPFDYKIKYRAVVNLVDNNNILTVAGAPEVVLNLSSDILSSSGIRKITKKDLEILESKLIQMSEKGLRVVAVGINKNPGSIESVDSVKDITFVGFLGMKDVLRPEVKDSMSRAKEAGVRVVMITGDHKITAKAIALEAGIFTEGDNILTGNDIDLLTDKQLEEKLNKTSIFARVTPDHKFKIINAFKNKGEIIAMTGDGVNDAPSLVTADLGVAMGGIGTEVAKEAADIVLLDDNFGSIISAIEEGRSIYKTIKKVILYLFSTNFGEVMVIVGALILDLPLPILAAQIIWLNFVTDGFLDVSLAMEPKEKGLLFGIFKKPSKYIVDKIMLQRMFLMALVMMIGTLYIFRQYAFVDLEKGWTVSLTLLAMFQWLNVWNCRSETKSVFRLNPFSNKFLVGATLLVIGLQVLAIYNPFLQKILHTVPLDYVDWIRIIPLAFSIILVEELRKFVYTFFNNKN